MRIGESSGMISRLFLQPSYQPSRPEIPGANLYGARSRQVASLWRNMNRQLLDLRDKSIALSAPEAFAAKSVVSARPDLVSGTAAAEAVVGKHTITVSLLAQAEKVGSTSFADSNTDLGLAGTFKVNAQTVEVVATDDLWDLATKLNDSGAGVTATVNLTDNGRYRLEVTANKSGAANGAEYVDGSQGVLASLGILDTDGQKASVLTEGADAVFTVDGAEHRSDSNTALAQGLTLQLTRTFDESVEVTVAENDPAVVEAVRDFVTSYNQALDDLSEYRASAEPADGAAADRFRNDLVALAQSEVSELAPDRSRLAYVGLKFEVGGRLSLDEEKLRQRLSEDRDGVAALFTAPQGIAGRFQDKLDALTKPGRTLLPESDAEAALRQFISGQIRSVTGGFSQRELALNTQIQVLNQSITLLGRAQQDTMAKLNSLFGTSLE